MTQVSGGGGRIARLEMGYNYVASLIDDHRHFAYYKQISPEIRALRGESTQMLAELKAEMATCEDPEQLVALNEAVKMLEQARERMLHNAPGTDNGLGFNEWKSHWQQNLSAVRDALVEGRLALMGEHAGGMTRVDPELAPPGPMHVVESSGRAGRQMDTAASEGAMAADEMIELMDKDPEAFMRHLEGLSEQERQMEMFRLQRRLQQVKQMFSMMSNVQKSAHDTSTATINNMRV